MEAAVRERGVSAAAGRPLAEILAPSVLGRLVRAGGSEGLDLLEAPVPGPMTAYRDLVDLASGFGVDDPRLIDRSPHLVPGYLVLAHGRFVNPHPRGARSLAPAGSAGAVVLECEIASGSRALWVAGNGDPSTIEGADLLLMRDAVVQVRGYRSEGGVLVIHAAARAAA